MQNGKTIDTPLLRGSTTEFPVDDVLSIERQNVHIKQDFLFEDNFKGDHLEFNFPIEGQVELEINQKYMHSKAAKDLVSLSAFEHKASSVYVKAGETIKQLSINLNPNVYFKDFAFTKKLTKAKTNVYKVSGSDAYINAIVQKLYGTNPHDSLRRAEMRDLVYELIEYCVAKISGNLAYHRCITRNDLAVVKDLRGYIEANFLKKLSLSQISTLVHSNEFKLKKDYREVYGETIFETIRKQRMQYAAKLILRGEHSLNEIAYLCGYESYPSFYKTFKKYFSHAPGYKKSV